MRGEGADWCTRRVRRRRGSCPGRGCGRGRGGGSRWDLRRGACCGRTPRRRAHDSSPDRAARRTAAGCAATAGARAGRRVHLVRPLRRRRRGRAAREHPGSRPGPCGGGVRGPAGDGWPEQSTGGAAGPAERGRLRAAPGAGPRCADVRRRGDRRARCDRGGRSRPDPAWRPRHDRRAAPGRGHPGAVAAGRIPDEDAAHARACSAC